jgi:hypothetical protein
MLQKDTAFESLPDSSGSSGGSNSQAMMNDMSQMRTALIGAAVVRSVLVLEPVLLLSVIQIKRLQAMHLEKAELR